MSSIATETETEPVQYVHYHDGGVPGKRRVLTGKAEKSTFTDLPRIDMSRLFSENLEDRKKLAAEVGAACRKVGFFYAVNHGVDQRVLDDTFEAVKKYFDLPVNVKMESHNQKTEKFRGYEAFLEGKLDPNTRGGKCIITDGKGDKLTVRRFQRRLPDGRRRYRPRTEPHYNPSNIQAAKPMAYIARSRILSPSNLPLLQQHV